MEDFVQALRNCDLLVVTDVYAASEKPVEGISAQDFCQRMARQTGAPVTYCPKDKIADDLLLMVKPHDIVLMLGAGDITRVADDFVRRLQSQSSLIEQVKL